MIHVSIRRRPGIRSESFRELKSCHQPNLIPEVYKIPVAKCVVMNRPAHAINIDESQLEACNLFRKIDQPDLCSGKFIGNIEHTRKLPSLQIAERNIGDSGNLPTKRRCICESKIYNPANLQPCKRVERKIENAP